MIVDSASSDDSARRIAETTGLDYVRCDRPGASRARNAGLYATTAPIVAFTDDDCIVAPDWSERLARSFSDPEIGFLTGAVAADRHARLPVSVVVGSVPTRFEGAQDPAVYGAGANMAFRREAIEAVGGFDEGLGPGTVLRAAEDQDLFWRLARQGWVARYDPAIIVTHVQWRSEARAVTRTFSYGVGSGAMAAKTIRLGERHGWQVLGHRVWRDGLARGGKDLRAGYQSGALSCVLGAAGVAVGALRGAVTPISGDKFAAPA